MEDTSSDGFEFASLSRKSTYPSPKWGTPPRGCGGRGFPTPPLGFQAGPALEFLLADLCPPPPCSAGCGLAGPPAAGESGPPLGGRLVGPWGRGGPPAAGLGGQHDTGSSGPARLVVRPRERAPARTGDPRNPCRLGRRLGRGSSRREAAQARGRRGSDLELWGEARWSGWVQPA